MPLARQSTHVRTKRKGRAGAKKKRYQRKFTRPASAIVKTHNHVGLQDVSLFGADGMLQPAGDPIEWHLIKPLGLNRVANSAPDDNDRQSNTIFVRNCSVKAEILPSKRYLSPIQIRLCMGWFKGDSAAGTQQMNAANLKTIYPRINDALFDRDHQGKQDFKWVYSRSYTIGPKNIYDEDTEEGDHTGADRVLVANWMPKKISCNFRFNRKHTFANADADSLDGWMPIIGIQCKPVPGGNQFTRPTLPSSADTGSNPGPRFAIKAATYFSDVR